MISSAQATPESEDAEGGRERDRAASPTGLPRRPTRSATIGDLAQTCRSPISPQGSRTRSTSATSSARTSSANLGQQLREHARDLAAVDRALDDDSGAAEGPVRHATPVGPIAPDQRPPRATATSITIPIHARRQVSISHSSSPSARRRMTGGSLGIDFVLDTTLTFSVDPSAITSAETAPRRRSRSSPPTIDLCANATGCVGVFTARFGFTDVKVSTDNPATAGTTEAATLHACANVDLQRPRLDRRASRWTSGRRTRSPSSRRRRSSTGRRQRPRRDALRRRLARSTATRSRDVETADASITFNDANLAATASTRRRPRPLGRASTPGTTSPPATSRTASRSSSRPRRRAGRTRTGRCRFLEDRDLSAALRRGQAAARLHGSADERDGRLRHGARATRRHFPTGSTDNLDDGHEVYCRAQDAARRSTPAPSPGRCRPASARRP